MPFDATTSAQHEEQVINRSSVGSGSALARATIAPLFVLAGIVHLANPDLFLPLMPPSIPSARLVVLTTGLAELVGAVALFFPRTRKLAGAMLALYAVCVYPVNILHAVRDLSAGTGLGWAYHYPRLFAQPLICWWALAAGGFSIGSRREKST